MLFLVLLQSVVLLVSLGLMVYWRLDTARRLDRLARLDSQRSATVKTLQTVITELGQELATLKARSLERPPPPIETHPSSAQAMTTNRRSQALKMLRRGDAVETVAAATGVPQNQIRMLQKVLTMLEPTNS